MFHWSGQGWDQQATGGMAVASAVSHAQHPAAAPAAPAATAVPSTSSSVGTAGAARGCLLLALGAEVAAVLACAQCASASARPCRGPVCSQGERWPPHAPPPAPQDPVKHRGTLHCAAIVEAGRHLSIIFGCLSRLLSGAGKGVPSYRAISIPCFLLACSLRKLFQGASWQAAWLPEVESALWHVVVSTSEVA
eukprot:scaffold50892_cov18-Tisochrysis_lutea.AAC.2